MERVRDVFLVLLFLGGGTFSAVGYLIDPFWFLPATICTALWFLVARDSWHRRDSSKRADED